MRTPGRVERETMGETVSTPGPVERETVGETVQSAEGASMQETSSSNFPPISKELSTYTAYRTSGTD
eukprot:CAMPEP_0194333510 /NCGR_PEP_ID=MMETSP0171-20130528/62945_1 /TAXON_ID=218684 /ORGANISM="Corethron pennatum, Strain L29A3" /LENGTH=66 /DNA_ID=CAMNT_0039095773 /DNA_START=63 /DNA_END=263 /DNA_ORIENTATION=-